MALLLKKMKRKTDDPPVSYAMLPSLVHDSKRIRTYTDALNHLLDNKSFFQGKPCMSYELHADHQRIQYAMVFPPSLNQLLFHQSRQTFKGSSFTKAECPIPDGEIYEFRLKRHSLFPLSMEPSPYVAQSLVSSLEQLQKGERAVLQLLFSPAHENWRQEHGDQYQSWMEGGDVYTGSGAGEMLQKMVQGPLLRLDEKTGGRREIKQRKPVKDIQKKLAQKGFCFTLRAAIQSHQASNIARMILSALQNASSHNHFEMKKVRAQKRAADGMQRRVIPFNQRDQIISTEELCVLWPFPGSDVESERLARMTPDEMTVDSSVTEGGYYIGNTIESPSRPVHLSTKHLDDAVRTLLTIAAPGDGKSTLIENMVKEIAKAGHGCAVFDVADGKLFERIISLLPEFKHRIIPVDLTDRRYPVAFNWDALGGEDSNRGMMFAEFFEVLFKTENFARTQSFLMKAALSTFCRKDTTLLDFIEILRNADYRKRVLPELKKIRPDLYLWWTREFSKYSEDKMREILSPIFNRLDMLIYNEQVGHILCQPGGKMAPDQWMNEGKIVVFNLSNGTFTEPEQRILMSLLNMMFWNHTLAREELTKQNKQPRPFHLIYDEPQTYMNATPMFARAVSKARKYRVSCRFFIQNAEQIIKESPALWKEIMGMAPHLLVGSVGEDTAKLMAKELGITVEDILAIKEKKYYFYLRTFVNKQAVRPFVFRTLLPIDEQGKVATGHALPLKKKYLAHFNPVPLQDLKDTIYATQMNMTLEEYRKALADPDDSRQTMDWGDDKNGGTETQKTR